MLPNGQGPSCDWDPDCTDCKRRSWTESDAVAETVDGHRVPTDGTVVPPCQVWPDGTVSRWCRVSIHEVCPDHG